ncbi:MAG TPA: sugar ABC transporter permease [Casimicrobiaceae bacterium]|jgi:multiple sugar transport system permease protein|nr:sugar ABC transporter permease [Casimicrobiaceae bacterium]
MDFLNRTFRHWSLLPAVVLFVLLTAYPVANLVRMSVSTIEFAQGTETWTFTPLRNLALLRADEVIPPAVRNTLIFVVAAVAMEMVLGLALALLVAGVSRGKGLVRTVMILPILVPPVAIGSMWKLLYNYDFGIFNQALTALHLPPVNWLGSTSIALWSVILVDVWHWVPFVFLILFAAVEALPIDVLEAARVDGATRSQLLRRVVLPLLKPAIVVALLFRTILAFKVFDEVFLLTSGGPGTSTELVTLHLYKVFFEQNQLGYGALLSLALIAAILAFLLVGRQATKAVRV